MTTISDQRACLLEWRQENIGSFRQILVGTPEQVLEELRPLVLQYLDLILDEHGEEIQARGLDELFQYEARGNSADTDWTLEDARKRILTGMDSRFAALKGTGESETIRGQWLEDLEWLLDALPHGDGVFIPIEDDIPQFAKKLLAYETIGWEKLDISDVHVLAHEWIDKLAVLASMRRHAWTLNETMKSFLALVTEFNERNVE